MAERAHDSEKAGDSSAFSISPGFSLEKEITATGVENIAGVDEAGRGALAGPLSVGLVIFPLSVIDNPPDEILDHVNDSKALSPRKRLIARDIILRHALHADVFLLSHRRVDQMNINGATFHAINLLVRRCPQPPGALLIDGNFSFSFPVPCRSVKKGDRISLSIAAASILAKITRDEIMERLDCRYPDYGFSIHKGYGTAFHRETIMKMGPCPIHRRTYEPVSSLLHDRNVLFPGSSVGDIQ